MDDKKKLPARVLRDFNDAGTAADGDTPVERRFKKGAEVELTEGELENFTACGLVEAIVAETAPVAPTAPVGEPEVDETKRPSRRG